MGVETGPGSALAHLAECGADALLGLPGLLRLAMLLPLEALHRCQKAGGFWLAVYHGHVSFRMIRADTRYARVHITGVVRPGLFPCFNRSALFPTRTPKT
jgi:hypothetical protein